MTGQGYLLDNRAEDAGRRFEALSTVFDAWTTRHLDALGLGTGWRCWEVGAGGPSLPTWLAWRVGATGDVLATDIDVSWVRANGAFRTLRHDVAADEPPGDGFDLVHARLVLTHVTEREEALRRMARALRPGGWLVVEDFDVAVQPLACLEVADAAGERANRVRDGFVALLAQRGVDLALGRTLARRLRSLGLGDVGADAYLPVALPGTTALELANVRQVRAGLEASGLAAADVDDHLVALAEGGLDIATPPLVTAWGRRT